MVWNSSQSSLYKAVEQHNSSYGRHLTELPCAAEERDGECKAEPMHSPKCCSNSPNNSGGNLIERILSDSDSLLLLAVLFVLIHEKADKNLIIAVALIMIL